MATAASTSSARSQPSQNWILGGIADHLLIIVAPVLGLLWGIATYRLAGGGLNGQVVVVGIFMIFNVAHHFPTFVRIYGDASLVKRFRWSLLLAPILVFTAALGMCSYLVLVKQYPLHYIVYLSIILTIWDPWHFLMQHYGFVRIYDRHNVAPRSIAARMDFWLCASWFTFCMIAATGWLPSLIYDFYHHFGVPLLFFLNGTIFQALWVISFAAAVGMTVVYMLYLGWCRRNGYFVSTAKLLLLLITFSIMYLTYAPNPLMQSMVPGWTFSMGFAVIGMVHVSQYLAIVWKYNRSLASREGASRTPLFSRLFGSRGRVLIGVMCGYVLACLLYGSFLTDYGKQYWFSLFQIGGGDFTLYLVIVLGSIAFTSTLTHYYYDGFIWKVRHKENRQNLAMSDDKPAADRQVARQPAEAKPAQQGVSWFESSGAQPIGRVLLRQSLYFLLPMGLLTALFWMSRDNKAEQYPIAIMRKSSDDRPSRQAEQQGRAGIALVSRQIEIERQMIELRPLGVHYCYLADLLFERAMCQHYWDHVSQGIPLSISAADISRLRAPLQEAKESYQCALELPPPYSHREEGAVMFDRQRPRETQPIQLEYIEGQIAFIDHLLGDN